MAEPGAHPLSFFNNKPPGIYYWYRVFFAVFGSGPMACHLTSTVPDLAVMLCLWVVGRKLAGPRVGNLAGVLYATLLPAVRLAGYGYTEAPLTACMLLASVVVTTERRAVEPVDGATQRASMGRAWAAGLLVGCATLFKQPAYLLGAAFCAWGASRARRGARLKWTLWFLAGVLLVQTILVGWLVERHALRTFVERAFVQGLRYGYADGYDPIERIRDWLRLGWAPMPAVATLGIATLASRRALATRPLGSVLIVPTLLVAAFSYEFYDHYLTPALPGLCLLAAEWLASVSSVVRRRLSIGIFAVLHAIPLVIFGIGLGRVDRTVDPRLAPWWPRPLTLSYQRRVAAFVMASTDPGEPILATGSEIPYLASRRNAYRYLGVAPYLRRLDSRGFDDFPAAADGVRILVLERWRLELLPRRWVESLDSVDGAWRRVGDLDHPEFVVYRRVRPPPTIGNS